MNVTSRLLVSPTVRLDSAMSPAPDVAAAAIPTDPCVPATQAAALGSQVELASLHPIARAPAAQAKRGELAAKIEEMRREIEALQAQLEELESRGEVGAFVKWMTGADGGSSEAKQQQRNGTAFFEIKARERIDPKP